MGAAFSCGENNDDLVNIHILLRYIKTKELERVFRTVDRGDYTQLAQRDIAYKDLSWRLGNIHISAPSVYCKVMEGLRLKPGLSFLNIGSGTGYLSTMAGLILGRNGTNHGIEMHEDCVKYAYEHLETFKQKSLDVDSFDFCEPVFQIGNILNVTPNRRYDRVYCGAACSILHKRYIKQFVKVGGILVMPYQDNLLRLERLDEFTWRNCAMIPVVFTPLVTPPEGEDRVLLQLPLWQPVSLQDLCRNFIRSYLRSLVWSEHDDLEERALLEAQSIDRTIQSRFGIPFYDEPNQVGTVPVRVIRAVVLPNRNAEGREESPEDPEASNESSQQDPIEEDSSSGEFVGEKLENSRVLEARRATEDPESNSGEEKSRRRTKELPNSRAAQKRRAERKSESSDIDDESDFMLDRRVKRPAYVHTIRKEKISQLMRKKVASLPLPLPLRIYLNCNREL